MNLYKYIMCVVLIICVPLSFLNEGGVKKEDGVFLRGADQYNCTVTYNHFNTTINTTTNTTTTMINTTTTMTNTTTTTTFTIINTMINTTINTTTTSTIHNPGEDYLVKNIAVFSGTALLTFGVGVFVGVKRKQKDFYYI